MEVEQIKGDNSFTPLAKFVRPAKLKLGFWRLVIAIFVVIICLFTGFLISLVVFAFINGFLNIDNSIFDDSPESMIALLISFGGIWLGLYIVAKFFSKQRFVSFFASELKIANRLIIIAVGISVIPDLVLYAAIPIDTIRSELPIDKWSVYLIPMIIGVLIQATAEELFFRGYLLQQLAARYRSWIIWAFIPSLIFGMLHYDPDIPNYGGYYYIVDTTLFGLYSCALVWRTGSLWASIILHVITNIIALSFFGVEGLEIGSEIWIYKAENLVTIFEIDILVTIIMLAVILSPIGRILGPGGRYNIPNHVA